MTPSEQSIADAERLLPGEVFARATALFAEVRNAGTRERALLAMHNERADLNEPDALRVRECLIFRLVHGDLAGDPDDWSMRADGRLPAVILDAEPLTDVQGVDRLAEVQGADRIAAVDLERNPSGYDDAPSA